MSSTLDLSVRRLLSLNVNGDDDHGNNNANTFLTAIHAEIYITLAV